MEWTGRYRAGRRPPYGWHPRSQLLQGRPSLHLAIVALQLLHEPDALNLFAIRLTRRKLSRLEQSAQVLCKECTLHILEMPRLCEWKTISFGTETTTPGI